MSDIIPLPKKDMEVVQAPVDEESKVLQDFYAWEPVKEVLEQTGWTAQEELEGLIMAARDSYKAGKMNHYMSAIRMINQVIERRERANAKRTKTRAILTENGGQVTRTVVQDTAGNDLLDRLARVTSSPKPASDAYSNYHKSPTDRSAKDKGGKALEEGNKEAPGKPRGGSADMAEELTGDSRVGLGGGSEGIHSEASETEIR